MILTVKIGEDSHSIDAADELEIHNADAERHTNAAQVAWWGSIAAAAETYAEKLSIAATKHYNVLIAECLKADAKVSEWKAKAMAGADDRYNELLVDAANAREQAARAQSIHWTFIRKMDMLKEMIKGEVGDRRASPDLGKIPGMTAPVALPDKRFDRFRNKRKTSAEE